MSAPLPFLWVPVLDGPGPQSKRAYIERNAVALLSGYNTVAIDAPSPKWLGHCVTGEKYRRSGLWNSDYIDDGYSPEFLDVFARLIADIA